MEFQISLYWHICNASNWKVIGNETSADLPPKNTKFCFYFICLCQERICIRKMIRDACIFGKNLALQKQFVMKDQSIRERTIYIKNLFPSGQFRVYSNNTQTTIIFSEVKSITINTIWRIYNKQEKQLYVFRKVLV